MTNPQNIRERSFALFKPSIYSSGVRGYPVYASNNNYGVMGLFNLSAQTLVGSVLSTFTGKTSLEQERARQIEIGLGSWIGLAEDMVDMWGPDAVRGSLVNISALAGRNEMERPALSDAGAYVKAAYWLAVAGRACAANTNGRTRLMDMAASWLEAGEKLGITEGSLNHQSKVSSLYTEALNAVRSFAGDEDPEAKRNTVFATVEGILRYSASGDGRTQAAAEQSAAQAGHQTTQDNAPDVDPPEEDCSNTIGGMLIPGYCERREFFDAMKYVGMAVGGILLLRFGYIQVVKAKASAKKIRGE